ncbi:MAG: 23S rRNA (guanosine(2251)-2'-O)-methyltransferase RlmB [Crocinitomicaceae bacterium]|jgi:23S rRNA (guanosine2251-2'-O)-methyltransferase|nr:23S rRNA (guanosine(2251)-2'-O)-methyltransferase RlmB [Crocinitomicaceae bacterium]MBT5402790.1 23S rRNA (guanosine(2251)-2'-O)-methyltransferase RlmB [Crocinitomicaceae bacterium]MBT6029293.1 23S rRNA (guanosine(2251)-2'-O)-methyltransferase RlmB [Crocinitomicaceae bacterium]MBT6513371.1 23S rRNA (guanosine(2251)-2'-O)-methyltransferase RlmB [Crocinitomicaceae bacterium]
MKTDYIYGIRAVIEAISSEKEINKILIQQGIQGDLFSELKNLLKEKDIPVQNVPFQKLNKLSKNGNHQGVIAIVSPIEYGNLEEIVEKKIQEEQDLLLLILDRLTDVRNLGSIARSAECLGVDAIIIPKYGAAQVTADAVKTSAGALNKITVCREDNLRDTLLLLQQFGVIVAACSEKATNGIDKVNLKVPLAIVMGSEENGVSKEIYKRCDTHFQIPMSGQLESMNVSVSCGIALYEVNRQRNA